MASPTSLTFCVASASSAAPAAQTITVTPVSGQSQTGFTDNGFPSWIKVSPTATGNTQNNNVITVQIDPSAYSSASAGTSLNGAVQISPTNGGNVINVGVTLNVDPNCAAANTITVTPASISFTAVPVGTTATQTQTLSVTGPAVQASVDSNSMGWLSVSAPTGTSPQTITVTANPSSLTTANNYTGTITISQVGNTANKVTVPVAFPVGTSGTGSITWTPNPANFSVTAGSTSTASFTITLSAPNVPGNVSLMPDPGTPFDWIAVSPTGAVNTLPAALTLTINPTQLTAGATYGATISVTPQGSQTTAQIRVNVTATSGSTGYTLNPTSLTFTVAPGSTTVTPQSVLLSGPSGAQNITATATIGSGPALWLGVSPASGGVNQNYTVSVNPANFTAGQTYTGTITFTQGSTAVASLPVTVNVGNTNTITVSPTQLNFLYQTGTNPPASQITQLLTITSPGNTNISYSASATYTSCANNWLVVSPSSDVTTGTVPRTITVSLNTSALLPSTTPATCLGTVTISAPSSSTPTVSIPVSVLVASTPLMVASPSTLTFNYTPGGSVPTSQTIGLASTSSTAQLSYTYAVNPGTSGGPIFLKVTSSATTSPANTPGTLTVALDPAMLANLAGGTYTDNIVVSSNSSANPTVVIPVTLTVSNASSFVANPSSLVFNYQFNANPQLPQPSTTITVSSTGAPLQFNATTQTTSCGNFLVINPTSGSTSPSTGVNGTQLQVSTTGLTALTSPVQCKGTISLTSPSGAMLNIPVMVNVVNTPVINIGTNSITQTAATGSTTPLAPIAVALSSSDNVTHLSFSVIASTNPAGQSWLSVTPQSGQTPSNLNVVLNPTNLPSGTYTGTINITDLTLNTPVPTQTIPVTFIVASPITVNPTSLTFSVNQGGAAPATQTLTLTGVPQGVTIGATPTTTNCGTGWITTTVSGNTVTAGITPTGLTQSQSPCTGQISIVVPGGAPVNVPVTVNVSGALAFTVSSSTVSFASAAGASTPPAPQTVNVSATGGAVVPFTATAATQTGGKWLTVSPATGNTAATPVPLTIGVDPTILATLGAGTYQGTVTIASTSIPGGNATVNVTLTVSMAAPPAVLSIVNAATQLPGPVSPGELVTIYGTNVGPATPAAGASFTLSSTNTVPNMLAGTQVLFDSTPAPILFVGPNQINAIVPYELAGRLQTNITVTRGGTTSPGILQVVAVSSPGIFTQDASGKGLGSILNQDNSINSPNHPAPKGSVISIYATGEGSTNPAGVTGSVTSATAPYPKPILTVTANFLVQNQNGSVTQVPATVSYAGEAPTLVAGVLQVNAAIPNTLPSGPQVVVITVGPNSSPATVTVWVQ